MKITYTIVDSNKEEKTYHHCLDFYEHLSQLLEHTKRRAERYHLDNMNIYVRYSRAKITFTCYRTGKIKISRQGCKDIVTKRVDKVMSIVMFELLTMR